MKRFGSVSDPWTIWYKDKDYVLCKGGSWQYLEDCKFLHGFRSESAARKYLGNDDESSLLFNIISFIIFILALICLFKLIIFIGGISLNV